MIWLEMVNTAARMAGLLPRAGTGLNGSQLDEVQHIINSHIDGLKAERLFVYEVERTQYPIVANQQDYRVGPLSENPDWVADYFQHLMGAGFLVPGQPADNPAEIPMEVILDFQQWQAVVCKAVTTSQPRVIYYRPTLPTATATLWPKPYQDGQLVLYHPQQVQEIDDIMGTVVLPQGMREFFEYEMAVKINEHYPSMPMKPSVAEKAVKYKSRVKANQFTPQFMRSDGAALGRVDSTRTGWWGAREYPGGYA